MDADLINRIHDAPQCSVIAVTGGGSGAISALLAVPGGSRTLLEAIVPYSSAALVDFLGGGPEQFCSPHTARQMAMAAFRRGERLRAAADPVVGLGCTASLASDRPKRGPHRIHVAAQSATATWSWSLELTKDARSRADEEAVAADVVLDLLAEVCGITDRPAIRLRDGETIARQRVEAMPSWADLLAGRIARTNERRGGTRDSDLPRAVFPGSFHPLHDGHRQMAAVAAKTLGAEVHFELSIENVEKPSLDFVEMEERAAQFAPQARVWFTRAPRMKQKAALFPGATIICGIDTLLRVADSRFAGGSEAERDRDLAEIASHGCRFLVFGRTVGGRFESLDDVPLPEALRRLCTGVPESDFRADVSSTELRRG